MSIRTPAHPSLPADAAPDSPPDSPPDPASVGRDLAALRTAEPLVQCITNAVVIGFTANSLLALGASPAMCDLPGEAGVFAGLASAVLVNLGTPGAEQREGAREAVAAATRAGTPWVLDPVAVGPLPVRTALAIELLEARPAIIRGNASEILALAGAGAGGRGVDAVDSVEQALDSARRLARRTGGIVAVSGAVDLVTDGERVVRVTGGHPLLTRVTGSGCALGAVMAAFLGAGVRPLDAAVDACAVWGLAAERAATTSSGPGSFAVGLLDALAALQPAETESGTRIA
ncbi:hydroxyethylthiazole kinase [Rathayibacter rathayi NCPPB 2980 = VKM Ac-1601]|uniref:hydroxyethylthiazole kinase n=1 Tax=Rathayibacter rathayi TaxID=33887 RepID=UPI000BD4907C|nr:hydroxyethylthiazole kinase [Rathayibacter rathayi]AZZ49127.1 hydroxyethylthiazole kinase [Rathayibacter rathayi]MWV73178.1 hydroxyethylthiazole kinase [Rathayibacter rathayi NCPPB 2980 = VKM Ac-1601]PPG72565.1 hydroxyethylthiazole kinase [Rathayibacter rathayi]PPG81126.1 hydroxyethylthiazole kinase [Rathayibacter rathayi]PPI70079.1 hydroxyethylthiazole kinase [Rathayibacter rathayi]